MSMSELLLHLYKATNTSVVEALARKIVEAARKDGHEIDVDDLSDMRFRAFKAGYFAANGMKDSERPRPARQARPNVIEISGRLRDGSAVKTDEDVCQWVYEYLDSFSQEIGRDHTPIDIFPAITRVMTEWIDVTSGLGCDKENAQALTQAIGGLTKALEKSLADLRDPDLSATLSSNPADVAEDAAIDAAVAQGLQEKIAAQENPDKTAGDDDSS
jgi:hypothetical protein